jgi:hypothetical protein
MHEPDQVITQTLGGCRDCAQASSFGIGSMAKRQYPPARSPSTTHGWLGYSVGDGRYATVTRVNSITQFGSQLCPPSEENDCCHRAECAPSWSQ